jgi:hypothetical protein
MRQMLQRVAASAATLVGICLLSVTAMAQGGSGSVHVFFIGATGSTQHVYHVYCTAYVGPCFLQDLTTTTGLRHPLV